jgi:hypothetical protein
MLPSAGNHRFEEQIMNSTQTPSPQTGIVVSTAISGGGWSLNHAEGIVVSTPITAGPGSGAGGVWLQHAEGIVVSTAIPAGGIQCNHAEGIVSR